jgi:hypothetical protein
LLYKVHSEQILVGLSGEKAAKGVNSIITLVEEKRSLWPRKIRLRKIVTKMLCWNWNWACENHGGLISEVKLHRTFQTKINQLGEFFSKSFIP